MMALFLSVTNSYSGRIFISTKNLIIFEELKTLGTIASHAWCSYKVVVCWNCFSSFLMAMLNARIFFLLPSPHLFSSSRLRDGYPFDEMRVGCCIALLWLKGNYIESLELALLCTANQAFKTSLWYSLSHLMHCNIGKKTSSVVMI